MQNESFFKHKGMKKQPNEHNRSLNTNKQAKSCEFYDIYYQKPEKWFLIIYIV